MNDLINKKTLSEQIYETIRADILERRIAFGDKLVNRELQERFGVSSTPVRDAINRLYQDGLVEDITKSGAKVVTLDLKNILEMNDIVCALNIGALRLCAKKKDLSELVSSLEECIALQKKYADSETYYNYDCLFHDSFFAFSGNSRYQKLYSQYQTLWVILVQFYYKDSEMTKKGAIEQHYSIMKACKSGDFILAQKLIEEHYAQAVIPLQKAMERK